MTMMLKHQWLTYSVLFFLFSLCISSTSSSEASNYTITNVLECDTSSHDVPPDLSTMWIANVTETCLYVTIQDQFGDGWGNSTNLFYWAQVGEQDSNIVSVGLDCTHDCGTVKSGCLRPMDLVDEDEHFFHLTVVAIDAENQLTIPDYFWEIQWSVQVVKGDDWREKYYGGINSSMVFNYNQEADDLTLAWSENLWQYPPMPVTCAAKTIPDQFFDLVYGDHGIGHQSYSYGYTANDTYFPPSYSLVTVPDLTMEQFGWLSCLSTDDPLSELYPSSYAFRSSRAVSGVEEGSTAWSLCGYSGHGAEELGMSVSNSGTCSGQYIGSVTDFCQNAVTSFPTDNPTMAPTISEASAYFDSFDSATLVQNAPAYQTESDANRVIFSYYINDATDFTAASAAWERFVADYLVSSFDVEFYSYSVWASYLKLGSATPVEWIKACDNKDVSDNLIASISSSVTSVTSSSCDRNDYMASSKKFCLGCVNELAFSSQCSFVETGIVSLPTQPSCYPNDASEPISKHAVVVEIFLREAVPASVPTLHFFTVTAGQQDLSVFANITTSSTGGKLYCRATETSRGIEPTRAAIKSRGVAVSIPPAAGGATGQNILMSLKVKNLFASTEYTVNCFTEDSVGNQMSPDEIGALQQNVETLCCQVLNFDFPPSSVKFGVTSAGSAVAPTVFKFSLPRLPSGSVVVTPTFYDGISDLQVTSLTASKAFFTFDSTTTKLGTSRSFATTATQSGSYYVKLVLSGDASEISKYSSSVASFTAREVGGVLPAPVLSSARLADSGGAVTLSFAEPTDFGLGELAYDHAGFWNCSLFLSFIGSEYTACSWQSDSVMLLSFCGDDICAGVPNRKSLELLMPGDTVYLKKGLLRAKCESTDHATCLMNKTPTVSLFANVSLPLNPLVPTVFLTASNPGGACDSHLVMDATTSTGAGGRDWADFSWTVKVDSAGELNITSEMLDSAVAVQATLNAAGDINYPVEVPFSLLTSLRYSVSLEVTNFLDESSFSTVFVDLLNGGSSAESKPSISVDGSSYRKISSFEPFELSISVDTPKCVSGNKTTYKWSVYRDITFQPLVKSVSADPNVMKLDPYALSSGYSYRFQVTVTLENGASDQKIVRVDVVDGSVYVKINGANKMLLPLNTAWTLDASDSVIEDISPFASNSVWAPMLSWSCFVAASDTPDLSYGDDCVNILNAAVAAPLSSTVRIPLRTEIMLAGGLYRVTASTYSTSGVYVSSTVDIEMSSVSTEEASVVAITSSFRKFNADRILQLFGSVTAPTVLADDDDATNVTMWWGVYDSYGTEMDLGTDLTEVFNTPPQKLSSVRGISSSPDSTVSFSLSTVPDIFTPGIEYIFRLSAEVRGSVTYASTTLVANSPPSSGKLLVLPTSGYSMSTEFSWSTIYWTDDIEDFPLQYTFQYQVKLATLTSSPDSFSMVGLASQKTFLTSALPAGRTSTGNVVVCAVSVSDFYEATAMASTEVVVEVAEENDVEISFSNFSATINAAVERMDWNGVAQGVSNAAALISLSDCQYAPDCDSRMRSACGPTTPPHTCGACAVGYDGLAGPSNVPCYDIQTRRLTSGDANVGSACSDNADCRYDTCIDQVCAYPAKTCPTANSNVCSGNGECEFYNEATTYRLVSSSGEYTTCFADDTSCSARCVCQGGFGKACSLNMDEYRNRSLTRELICESLYHLIVNKDQSSELADFLAASVAISYDPSEMISPDGFAKCLRILDSLTNISYGGHFRNEGLVQSNATGTHSIPVHENFAELIGAFVDTLALLNATKTYDNDVSTPEEWISLSEAVEVGVDAAVTALSRAIGAKMVPGQKSLEVVTGGVRLRVSYDSFADLKGALLAPPLTEEEQQYGSPVSGMILPASGLASCSGEEASEDVGEDEYMRLSVMLWGSKPYSAFNSTTATASPSTNVSTPSAADLVSRVLRFAPIVSANEAGSSINAVQTDPYSVIIQYATEQNWTNAEPSCGRFQDGEATTCPCNVTDYDSFSVTFECYNLLDFCPPSSSATPDLSTQRRLATQEGRRHGGDTRHPHYGLTMLVEQRRRLDFDYGGATDDDAAPSGSLMDYAVMFTSLGSEFTSTLSTNPFTSLKDLDAAMPVLFMMSVLVFVVVVGYLICDRWDRYDRVYLKYVMLTTADKRYKAPTLLSLKNAFMEKTFITQKRKSMMTFQDLGSKLRNDKARSKSETGHSTRPTDHTSEMFFEDIYHQPAEMFVDEKGEVKDRIESFSCVPTIETIKDFVHDTQHTEEAAQEAATLDKMGHKIATFFDTALPPTSLLERSNGWTRLFKAVLRHHDWFRVFSFSSLRLPRTIRFLIVCTDVLILFFVDSIFYGVLFPDDGTCTAWDNTSADECMADPSKFASGSSLCLWDDEKYLCEIRPPPASIEFYMIVAIVVSTLSILPQAICHLVLEEVCALEPVYFKHIHRNDSANLNILPDSDSDADSNGTIELAPKVLDEKWEEAKDKYLFKDGFDTKKLYERYVYFDFTTAEEEATMLLRFITNSLENRLKSAPIPWRNDKNTIDGLSAANLEAIMSQLGIHADGSPVELSWIKRVLRGTTPRQRVISKIKRVRRGVDIIMDDIDNFPADMEDYKETTMIQHFILEQLTPFKRYALKRQFFQFDCAAPDKIEGSKYLMGWGFISFVWLFCVYWVYSWAIQNSGVTMSSWSFEIGFVLLQDTLVNDMVQVILVHVIAIEALRPQLKRIYAILNQILNEKISTEKSSITQQEREDSHEFCVAQHLSSTCRAARRPELHYLSFSQLLMRITDYDVSQCRDERGIHLSGIVVALLAIPTALALSHEIVQDTFLDVILPTAWACFCIANAYALMLGPWALIVPYTLFLLAVTYRQLVIVPRLRKRNLRRVMNVEGYKFDTKEDLMWQNMNRQLELVHLNTLNVTEFNPLNMKNNAVSSIRETSTSTGGSPRPRRTPRGDDCDGSVMSELTGPLFNRVNSTRQASSGRRRGGSIGGFSEHGDEDGNFDELSIRTDSASPVQLPAEITGMQNHTAKLQFIQAPVKSKDRSVLGIASVNKMLGLARPTKLKRCHVADKPQYPPQHRSGATHDSLDYAELNLPTNLSTVEIDNDSTERSVSSDASSAGPSNPMVEKKEKGRKREEVLDALKFDSPKNITTDLPTVSDEKKKRSPLNRGMELTRKLSDKIKPKNRYMEIDPPNS